MIIAGAGLAGLIAGHIFPNAKIIEREAGPQQLHNALLRFRSDAIANITGVPFRRVTVRKGVWVGGRFVEPNIALANAYSSKCLGRLLDRSIWSLAPAERFIAPGDFYARLVDACGARIEWGVDVSSANFGIEEPVVSTIPMPVALTAWGVDGCAVDPKFHRAAITVARAEVPGADVHQTVYFPERGTGVYRASITGSTLIVESVDTAIGDGEMRMVCGAFGLQDSEVGPFCGSSQRYGKIAPIDNRLRKEIIHRLTTESGVYSVGRFATWRNILLDDVVKDLRIVKAMIEQNDIYSRRLSSV